MWWRSENTTIALIIVAILGFFIVLGVFRPTQDCPECPECVELPPFPNSEPMKGEIWWDPDEEKMYVYRGWVKMVEEEEKK